MLMATLELYHSSRFGKLHILNSDAEPMFLATDVCANLGITDPDKALALLGRSDLYYECFEPLTGVKPAMWVDTYGLKLLEFYSHCEQSQEYHAWVCKLLHGYDDGDGEDDEQDEDDHDRFVSMLRECALRDPDCIIRSFIDMHKENL